MAREGAPESKTRGNGRKLTRERGRLSDSLGAWNMSDEEEERIVSSLKKNWKKTTLAIRAAEEKPPEDDQDVDKLVKISVEAEENWQRTPDPLSQQAGNGGRGERTRPLAYVDPASPR